MVDEITGFGSIKSIRDIKKRAATSSTSATESFADLLSASGADEAPPPAPLSDTAPANSIGNLLSLQEVSEEEHRRQTLIKQGGDMLEVLEQLRMRLIGGNLTPSLMAAMDRQLSVHKQHVNDPALQGVIDDIELRLAVEKAKLEQAMKPVS